MMNFDEAFDKAWHNGLIYKLKQNGGSGNLLNLIIDFLDARKQRVVLHGQYFHGQVLKQEFLKDHPLSFLIYINDVSEYLVSNPKLLADNTSLFSVVQDITLSVKNLNDELKKINEWAFQ